MSMYTTIQKIGQVVFFKEMNYLISKDRLNWLKVAMKT